ncbi:MAG: D-alanyl-D-alanine carboxypeptidase family protein, partial [Pseudomonadota bacterium]
MVRLFRRLLTGVCVVMLACVSPRAATAGPTLLIDDASGRVLYAEDADQLWYPASLTKIMTAYLAFRAVREGRLAMDKKIPVSERANKMPASKIGLPVGAEMGLELAIRTVIIKSANDVSVMLAEAIDGSVEGFVANMNRTARRLGMTSTTFENPNGLPAAGQMTTARDLALLTRAVVREFPEHLHYWATPTVKVGRARLRSQNALLRSYEGATGFKTGFICDSGFNIVATAERDGR